MKTITLQIDDEIYDIIKSAAEGNKRSIQNYIEYLTVKHLTEDSFVSNEEMEEIEQDAELVARLKQAHDDVTHGRFTIVE